MCLKYIRLHGFLSSYFSVQRQLEIDTKMTQSLLLLDKPCNGSNGHLNKYVQHLSSVLQQIAYQYVSNPSTYRHFIFLTPSSGAARIWTQEMTQSFLLRANPDFSAGNRLNRYVQLLGSILKQTAFQ